MIAKSDPLYVAADGGGTGTPITGRAARMIRWITEEVQNINDIGKGEVRFCFAGDSLAVHTTVVDPNP